MISRRTLLKYTGLGWLFGLGMTPGGITYRRVRGAPPVLELDSDTTTFETLVRNNRTWKPVSPTFPKNKQVVLLATSGGGGSIWLARYYAPHDSTLHGKPLHTTWCFVTLENDNELWPDDLGDYKWMELPLNPFTDDGKWRHRTLVQWDRLTQSKE